MNTLETYTLAQEIVSEWRPLTPGVGDDEVEGAVMRRLTEVLPLMASKRQQRRAVARVREDHELRTLRLIYSRRNHG